MLVWLALISAVCAHGAVVPRTYRRVYFSDGAGTNCTGIPHSILAGPSTVSDPYAGCFDTSVCAEVSPFVNPYTITNQATCFTPYSAEEFYPANDSEVQRQVGDPTARRDQYAALHIADGKCDYNLEVYIVRVGVCQRVSPKFWIHIDCDSTSDISFRLWSIDENRPCIGQPLRTTTSESFWAVNAAQRSCLIQNEFRTIGVNCLGLEQSRTPSQTSTASAAEVGLMAFGVVLSALFLLLVSLAL